MMSKFKERRLPDIYTIVHLYEIAGYLFQLTLDFGT